MTPTVDNIQDCSFSPKIETHEGVVDMEVPRIVTCVVTLKDGRCGFGESVYDEDGDMRIQSRYDVAKKHALERMSQAQ